MNSTKTFGVDQIDQIAQMLYQLRDRCKVYAFSGPLGAGKTSLAQQLLRKFGVQGVTSSPTFTYVNMYHLPDGGTLYHFDLYRISSVDEFIVSGFNEYLYQPNSWAIIEWPEVIAPLISQQVCEVQISYKDEGSRELKLKVID